MDMGSLIFLVFRNAVPLVFTSVGEIITEKSGVLNLSIEGVVSISALVAFVATAETGNPYIGLLTAITVGAAIGIINAYIFVVMGRNQVLIGLLQFLMLVALANAVGSSHINQSVPQLPEFPFIAGAVLVAWGAWFFLNKTYQGLNLRSIGERPEVPYVSGVNVTRYRQVATVFGSAMFGLAGGYMSLVLVPFWAFNIASGYGWIGYAICTFSGWHPLKALAGSIIFGALTMSQFIVQGFDWAIPHSLLMTLPYLFAILAAIRQSRMPTALGKSWRPVK